MRSWIQIIVFLVLSVGLAEGQVSLGRECEAFYPAAIKGISLADIQDPKVVSKAHYLDIVSNFARKYRSLQSIETKGYRYQLKIIVVR